MPAVKQSGGLRLRGSGMWPAAARCRLPRRPVVPRDGWRSAVTRARAAAAGWLASSWWWFAEDFFRQGGHRLEAEDRFDGEPEEVGDGEGQFEAGVVVAAFDVADRLVVDAELVGELFARQPAFGPEHGEPVVDFALVVRHRRAGRSPRSRRASARAAPGCTRSPTWRRARRCWR